MNAPVNLGPYGTRAMREHSRSAAEASTAQLDKVASEVRACLRSEAASIVTQQFLAGRHVAGVQEDSAYGKEGVRTLATKLKLPWKFLLRLSARARAFSEEVVTAAIASAVANNYVLSISIFDELVGLDSAEDKKCYLEDAIAGRWTVRQLRQKLGARQNGAGGAGRPPLPRVIGCAEALMAALEAVTLGADADQHPGDRERALATLAKLSLAVNSATQRLVAAMDTEGREAPELP